MTPQQNGPLSENKLPEPNKILKMISQQTGWPLSQIITHPAQKHQKNWRIEGVYSLRFNWLPHFQSTAENGRKL